ncbi:MAG: SUMF1/EgtB/PvdO family nonheme iron enzyme [Phycisphaerae bacterium]|jgi:formylglycine-generating enzyme required for sulfatase activity|nr:SUMF1/EgtB/PvdO family nonheme iron enzyme [Phycisphaerae bacterium]
MLNRIIIPLAVVAICFSAVQSAPAAGVSGKYVHVVIPGGGKTLSLAEVQVFSGGKNVALKKKTVQSSTASRGSSARAVDGNTSGDWSKGSITHTVENVADPAWEVDLGKSVSIEKVSIWNRDGYEARLHGSRVMILDAKRKVVWSADLAKPGKGATTLTVTSSRRSKLAGKTIAKIKPKKNPVRSRARKRGRNRRPAAPGKSAYGTAESLRMAIKDLTATYGAKYPKGKAFLAKLDALAPKLKAGESKEEFEALRREALLANPLLDFDKILLVRRKGTALPANWQGNSSMKKTGYENDIAVLSPLNDGEIKTLYKPDGGKYVGETDLNFDADKILFSSVGANGAWAVCEIKADGTGLRQVSPDMGKDIDNYDPVYLPSGKIIFDSTTGYSGVPCVGGKDYVANLHLMDANGKGIRRLCFEQDNDWYPVMLNNGRVMFLRWEYTDSAHYFSRVLMHMNPDGTDQKAYYGSNSYWPNSLFYARPVPNSSTKFVGIVSGHHGTRRSGPLVLFDTSLGRFEADGAVQLIGQRGKKVEALVVDGLAGRYKPHFLHPYPLSDKYFLTSANLGGWNLFLVDVFDNMLLLKKDAGGMSLFEPVPFRKTRRPAVLPDRTVPGAKEATVIISDIYVGPGLKGVPRGAVKNIRVFKYEYGPRRKGGHYAMGMEAGWDAHIILGTVPVETDGSTTFQIPANTPIALQPLDEEGKALQLMRSWLVGMPGERLSCIGCHESQDTAPATKMTLSSRKQPKKITPWYGPARGFSFKREVQPVLDKFCVGCHSGKPRKDGKKIHDLHEPKLAHRVLHPYVRRNGPEGDYHLLTPLEFHADTSELVQMFQKGHNNVKLDKEAWDRLITWIDLNAPWHGTWTEAGASKTILQRRLELRKIYASVDSNPEFIYKPYKLTEKFIKPAPMKRITTKVSVTGWPFDQAAAKAKQGPSAAMELDLGGDVKMGLVKIPAGAFAMGSNTETPQEMPVTKVTIAKAFYMGATEVTLGQYKKFDPKYKNGVYDKHYKDQVNRGYYMDTSAKFPVIRVSWRKAMEYCAWLSKKTGKKVSLPTEAQWEWACRAGTSTPLSFGDKDTDFSKFANLADVKVKEMAVKGVNPKPIRNPKPDVDYELKDVRFNDGVLHLADVGKYAPNAWGLHDMHGNVAEWTRSQYKSYPYSNTDGRNSTTGSGKRVIRGGSWHDRQHRSSSSYRLGYPDWQKVYHVGFRVVVE